MFGSKFAGVYASNTLPKKLARDKFYIVNTDPNYSTGEHWLALYNGYVYDSFGRSAGTLSKYLKGRGLKRTEPDVEQKMTETNCGARSLAALDVAKKYKTNGFKKI